MRKLFALAAAAALALTAAAIFPMEASARAFVSNSGRDDPGCSLQGGWSGTGSATLVVSDSGEIMITCHGTVFETPPANADRFLGSGPFGTTCKIVVTPSGNFNATCH